MRTRSTRSRWWFPGGGSHHPFIYRASRSNRTTADDPNDVVIDLRAVDLPGSSTGAPPDVDIDLRVRSKAHFLAR